MTPTSDLGRCGATGVAIGSVSMPWNAAVRARERPRSPADRSRRSPYVARVLRRCAADSHLNAPDPDSSPARELRPRLRHHGVERRSRHRADALDAAPGCVPPTASGFARPWRGRAANGKRARTRVERKSTGLRAELGSRGTDAMRGRSNAPTPRTRRYPRQPWSLTPPPG